MSIQLTGSLYVTGSITASAGFNGTSSYATNALSASYSVTASYAINAGLLNNTSSTVFATTGSNTFSGNQTFNGSIKGQVLPLNIIGNTASIDFTTGNFYTLQLVSGSTIFVNATNIQSGQFSLLEISTVSQSAISFSDNVIQGSPSYTPTQGSSKDLLSFSSFNTSSVILAKLAGDFGRVYPIATGGTITTSGSYKIHTFTSSVDFTITNAVTAYPFEYLIVGAGGNSGVRSNLGIYGGGGGAAGLVQTSTTTITTTGSTAFPVVVGINTGSRTSSWNSISATGGGNGGNGQDSGGGAGPGGGGSNASYSGGPGDGGTGNGGGGAGSSASSTDTNGGTGTTSTISGTSVNYAIGGNGFGGGVINNPGNGGNGGFVTSPSLGKDGIVIIKYQYQA